MGMTIRGAAGGLGCDHGRELEWLVGTAGLWKEGRVRPTGTGVGKDGPNWERDVVVSAAAIVH